MTAAMILRKIPMKNDEKLWKICLQIYKEAYLKSDPPADFDALMKAGKTKVSGWFYKYYLPDETFQEIVRNHCKKNKLNTRDAHRVSKEVFLGCAPSGVKR